jgi:hypothetical protein
LSANLAGLEGVAGGEVIIGLLEVGERFLVEDVERQMALAEQRIESCD